jgi:hypothetical protein
MVIRCDTYGVGNEERTKPNSLTTVHSATDLEPKPATHLLKPLATVLSTRLLPMTIMTNLSAISDSCPVLFHCSFSFFLISRGEAVTQVYKFQTIVPTKRSLVLVISPHFYGPVGGVLSGRENRKRLEKTHHQQNGKQCQKFSS